MIYTSKGKEIVWYKFKVLTECMIFKATTLDEITHETSTGIAEDKYED